MFRYWCGYGPEDERGDEFINGPVNDPIKTLSQKEASSTSIIMGDRKRRAPITKGQTKRGCQCHFTVNRLYERPDIAMISYVHPYHTDNGDLLCHGEPCKGDKNAHILFSPWISLDKKMWVSNLLYRGFTPHQVMERHIQDLHALQIRDPKLSLTRDDFLSMRDVVNISSKLAVDMYQLHEDDAESTRRWCIQNGEMTFIYQEQDSLTNMEFILGIQTPWQKEMCRKFGDGNLLAMDATFGTNKYKVCTLLLFILITLII